jgi:RND family efflux transporter MFP subunit
LPAQAYECLIEPWQVVEVRSPVDGIIARLHVQRGDAIRKGQPLVELESAGEQVAVDLARYRSQMDGQIALARNRLDLAAKKLVRANDLHREQYASAQARDEADAERRLAESELQAAIENRELARIEHRRAVEQLALRTLHAPFQGVVVDRLLNPGDLAEAGAGRKAMLKVAQIDPLRVDIVLPASQFGRVAAGMTASVTPLGASSRYTAAVKLVDKVVDAASGTFVARLALANPSSSIAGGVRCQAQFETLPEGAAKAPAAVRP